MTAALVREMVPAWSHQKEEDRLSALARASNLADLALVKACTPELGDDVENHVAALSVRIGATRGRCLSLCDTGLMLQRFPAIARYAQVTGAIPLYYLSIIASGTAAVVDSQCEVIERHILELIVPTKDNQALIGPRKLARQIGEVVYRYDDRARNDDDHNPPTHTESLSSVSSEDGKHQIITAVLRNDRAREFAAALNAIVNKGRRVGKRATLPDALMQLVRGSVSTAAVLNIYQSHEGGPLYMDGAGEVSDRWLDRVKSTRVIANSVSSAYAPSSAQVAFVRGRDGTCRFPGCDVPAHRCDIDHIKPHGEGGPTDTTNLHCLCRRHHNLKTSRLWNVATYSDATELWTSATGITATSAPTGPISHHGRRTFTDRAVGKTLAIRNKAREWLMWLFSAEYNDG